MYKSIQATAALTIFLILNMQHAMAASTKDEVIALKEEVSALKEGQAAMQKDLADIKKLLESGAKPAAPAQAAAPSKFEPKDVSVAGAPFKGEEKAQLTLIEYSDYQCPFCSRHNRNTMPQLTENYISNGKLKFVMREFPLTSLHPRAVAASLAALCANDQGKYWEMHDVLFDNQRKMSDDEINSYAETINLNMDDFVGCMEAGKYNDQVASDLAEGRGLGISGTPSFALGITDPDDPSKVKVMKIIKGARAYESFAQQIDLLLNQENEGAEAP